MFQLFLVILLAPKLAFVRDGNVWVKRLPDQAPVQVSQGDHAEYPQWSPSGRWLTFRQNFKTIAVSDNGQRMELTAEDGKWCPLRDEFAVLEKDGLSVVSFEGNEPQKRIVFKNSPPNSAGSFVWSPDASTFALSVVTSVPRGRPDFPVGHLWRVDVNGAAAEEIFTPTERGNVIPLAWSSDGRDILIVVKPGFAESVSADGLALISVPAFGGPTRVLASSMLVHEDFLSVSARKNDVLVVSGPRRDMWTEKQLTSVDPSTGRIVELTDNRFVALSPRWSPDANRIAYVAGPDIRESQRVVVGTVRMPNGKATRQPVRAGGEEKATVNSRRIWMIDSDGKSRQLTSDARYHDEYPIWTPDGDSLLFVRIDLQQNKSSVWTLSLTNGQMERIVEDVGSTEPNVAGYGFYGYVDWSRWLALSTQ